MAADNGREQAGCGDEFGADSSPRRRPTATPCCSATSRPIAANPSLYKKLPFDPDKDFAPVTLTARFLSVLVANPEQAQGAFGGRLIAREGEPGKIDIAHAGLGNPFHLAAVLFQQAAGIRLNEVPYRGAAPADQGLLGGDVPIMFVDYATARSHLAAGT